MNFCVAFRHENDKAIVQMVPSTNLEMTVKDNANLLQYSVEKCSLEEPEKEVK